MEKQQIEAKKEEGIFIKKRVDKNTKSFTSKIYVDVHEKISEFLEEWNMLKPQDIVSAALEEYIERHK